MTLFVGGAVFDGARHLSGHAVLVADGRVRAVVPEAGLDPHDIAGHEVVDLAGGLVAPGFVDAHVHPVQGGLERLRCDLSGARTREDYLLAIRAYADAHPDEPWIRGGGWSMTAFEGGVATAADLDAVVSGRPVFLANRDHHGAWVSSRALELAGVDPLTADPADGHADRDADGRILGTLHEGAMGLVERVLPPTTPEEYDDALREGQRYLHAHGVTGWQDAILGAYLGVDDPSPSYRRLADAGELTATVVGALWWERGRGLEQVADLVERRERLSGGRLRATSVKIMQDGIVENGTAALLTPYLDRCGHGTGLDHSRRGHSFVDAAVLREAVGALDAAGFQVHVHAIGDRGVRETLDAFAALDPVARAAHRHHVAHLQLIHPDDVARFAALDVTANLQALWACYDDQMLDLTLDVLGEERSGWQYPFADLYAAGTALAMGSDWPVTSPDPLAAIHVAVNRTAYGAEGREGHDPFLPGQALDLTTAFAAYTAGSARVCHRDDAGRLSPAYVADLVVLDRDPFAGPPEEIGATRVVSTWIDGRQIGGGRVGVS